jgi:antitoxin VapB
MLQYRPTRTTVLRERRVKLFRNGRNQAVRMIPREFELSGKDAVMRKEG